MNYKIIKKIMKVFGACISVLLFLIPSAFVFAEDSFSSKKDTNYQAVELSLEISFEVIENQKSIIIRAKEKFDDQWILISDLVECSLSSPTLFGDLLIENVHLSDGIAYVDFPENLPGDENGLLIFNARILDNEKYANISAVNSIDWGEKTKLELEAHGKLWTTDPPTWMLIAFVTFLFSVWTSYIFVFIKVWRVRKTGKQLNS
ncbi:MAG: hypothetical protein HOG05_03315 [Bacteroidetes bacterium]|jgi:hypothetical protein|nr:hypothetical protein [Bacteroidota bacterium]MBT3934110.1 hypothetical protein [Bacteroidota bacterium]MBT5992328.1 hypothetical protein [Bacteroidota bacterium]MBT7040726.1 hypothetical protein [Bacteroidota bacterium]